jgi:hypothetical protein
VPLNAKSTKKSGIRTQKRLPKNFINSLFQFQCLKDDGAIDMTDIRASAATMLAAEKPLSRSF